MILSKNKIYLMIFIFYLNIENLVCNSSIICHEKEVKKTLINYVVLKLNLKESNPHLEILKKVNVPKYFSFSHPVVDIFTDKNIFEVIHIRYMNIKKCLRNLYRSIKCCPRKKPYTIIFYGNCETEKHIINNLKNDLLKHGVCFYLKQLYLDQANITLKEVQ